MSESSTANAGQIMLETELIWLKTVTGLGHQVGVRWLPGEIQSHRGRKLKEYVKGDIIEIYVRDRDEAIEALHHGFIEWILHQCSKPYLKLVNKLIEGIEELQYDNRHQIIAGLEKILRLLRERRDQRHHDQRCFIEDQLEACEAD